MVETYREEFPDRTINMGIAESNLMGVAAGMALSGKTVYVYTHAIFATNSPYEQIKLDICLVNLPVKIVGVGHGLDYSTLGPSHHALDDIGLMRLLPNMTIFSPSDDIAAQQLCYKAHGIKGPVYIRLDREGTPLTNGVSNTFENGLTVLRHGRKKAIVSTGRMVVRALEMGYKDNATVVDLYRIKPANRSQIHSVTNHCDVTTLEEHSVIGGIGDVVEEAIGRKVRRLGVQDKFCTECGERDIIVTKAVGL